MVWLLAAAVPMYGTAAVSLFACGPVHHESAAALTADAHAKAGHASSQGFETASRHVPGVGAAGYSIANVAKLAVAKCNACSASGILAALLAAPLFVDTPAFAEAFSSDSSRSAAAFLTGGPERPPRTVLA